MGDTYVLSELSVKFTVQKLISYTYLADVNFHIKVLIIKVMIIFQKFLNIYIGSIPRRILYLVLFLLKNILFKKNLY